MAGQDTAGCRLRMSQAATHIRLTITALIEYAISQTD